MERLHIIFLRHLISGLFILALPFVVIISRGLRDYSDLFAFLIRQAPVIAIWILAILFTAILGIRNARNRIWDGVARRYLEMDQTTLDLHAERRLLLRLFLKWGRCFRCLAFWYGGFISILCWVFAIYEWSLAASTILILYFFIVGASLSAAFSALYLLFTYTKHREDTSQDFFG
ncbi:MAG TPA: hypothetical protein DEA96_01390 [Leptospiraceae bacterium]|nr:hypothetical protein [Spirochaetaceae bacterium]HBS03588.1 hypothetical protein [Leptospiraceae bacterium]